MALDLNNLTIPQLSGMTLPELVALLLDAAGTETFVAHPRGRQAIGVNQPPHGGNDYPFVNPSANVQQILGDFYLSYEDDTCNFVLPFSVAWMYGFGALNVTPIPGMPDPTSDYDILVTDANGATVFDSTTCVSFKSSDWPSTGTARLRILEWQTETAVCRCTTYLTWTQEEIDQGIAHGHPNYLVPDNGELDPRTLNRVPARLKQLVVAGNTFNAMDVLLVSGYNVVISEAVAADDYSDVGLTAADFATETATKSVIVGTRRTSKIQIKAEPGDGLGTYDDCTELYDPAPPIKQINGASPDDAGNLILDAEGCLRSQRPVYLESELPERLYHYYSSDLVTDPYPVQGITDTADERYAAALELHNDCGPCCDCDYFIRTYQGLKRQWNLWKTLAEEAEDIRDLYVENRDIWLAQKTCREANPVRLVLISEPGCKVAGGAIFCNTSGACIIPLTLRFTFRTYQNGVLSGSVVTQCSDTTIEGSAHKRTGEEAYTLRGTFPAYEAGFDYADPQDTSRVSFRMCFPDCSSADNVEMVVTAHYESDDVEEITPDAWMLAAWAAAGLPSIPMHAQLASKLIPLDSRDPFCAQCICN